MYSLHLCVYFSFTAALFAHCWCMSLVSRPPDDMIPEDVSSDPSARLKALKHIDMMFERQCRDPVPKLFVVGDLYPSTNMRYRPHCVTLHRCDNDAGCCGKDSLRCTATAFSIIYRHFNVSELTASGRRTKIMKMPFVNHTACACESFVTTPR